MCFFLWLFFIEHMLYQTNVFLSWNALAQPRNVCYKPPDDLVMASVVCLALQIDGEFDEKTRRFVLGSKVC